MGHSPILLAWVGAMKKMLNCSQLHVTHSNIPFHTFDIDSDYGDRMLLWIKLSGWKSFSFIEDDNYKAQQIFARMKNLKNVSIKRELGSVIKNDNLKAVFYTVMRGPICIDYALMATVHHMAKNGAILIMFVDYEKLQALGNFVYKDILRVKVLEATFKIETRDGHVYNGTSIKREYITEQCRQHKTLLLEQTISALDVVIQERNTFSSCPDFMEPHVRWFLTLFTFVRIRKI